MAGDPLQRTVDVALEGRGYPIRIGPGLLDDGRALAQAITGHQALVVTGETVARHYLDGLCAGLPARQVERVVLPDGERYKTIESCQTVWDRLMACRFERSCTVIALGGGVIGDLAGFAAASYQRGVAFIQIPTTLLAQVDSSVGGKTGVNHPRGKNMIGAFHQPRLVIADTRTLDTLPDREMAAGVAEVIKYGLIRDAGFFEWLEAHLESVLRRDPAALAHAIERSCRNKAEVVAADERESGVRATLNLGHTFGHAIETATGYSTWLHGEAIAAGMVMAADLARRLDWLTAGDYDRIEAIFRRAGLPVRPPEAMDSDRFLELMAGDKKAQGGRIRLVVQRGIGEAVVTDQVPADTLQATLAALTGRA